MRVIAGQLRGHHLLAPKGTTTRPTTDRVREALFAMLGPLDQLLVLDLYAGTGALGIEALSRGAASACFVESHRAALDCLRRNLTEPRLGERAVVLALRVERAVTRLVALGPFDLVLCDPPWSELEAALRLLGRLLEHGVLAEAGRLVLEHPHRTKVPSRLGPSLEAQVTRNWGDTQVTVFAAAKPPVFCAELPDV